MVFFQASQQASQNGSQNGLQHIIMKHLQNNPVPAVNAIIVETETVQPQSIVTVQFENASSSSPVEMTARQRREANLGIVLVSISVVPKESSRHQVQFLFL